MNGGTDRHLRARAQKLARHRPGLGHEQALALLADPWFRTLTEELQLKLVQSAAVRQVPARMTLGRQGAVPEVWFAVAAGAVKVSSYSAEGRETVIDLLEPGQWLGDGPLLADEGQPYAAEAVAHSTLLVMRRAMLHNLLMGAPELGVALARLNWMRASRVMRHLHEQAEPLLEDRVRRFLNTLAKRFGSEDAAGVQIELPLAQSDLALMVQGSRQRINAVLGRLERLGELRRGQGSAFGVTLKRRARAEGAAR
jgi:CRP/FNR family transcriptional regulator, cyclic AMP receptor protein